MRDPDVRARVGQSMVWNVNRYSRMALIRAGINPGIEPNTDGFYEVSFHTTLNSAYAVQNRVRTDWPDFETRVRKVTDKEWKAVIQVKLKADAKSLTETI